MHPFLRASFALLLILPGVGWGAADLVLESLLVGQGACKAYYRVRVRNLGPDTALNPSFTVILPKGLSYQQSEPASGDSNSLGLGCRFDGKETVICRPNQIPTVMGSGATAGYVVISQQPGPANFDPIWTVIAGTISETADPALGPGTSTNNAEVKAYRVGNLTVTFPDNVDVFDVVTLQNFLVGNVQQGTAPFLGPLYTADLDVNSVVDIFDLVLLQNFIVGNVACVPQAAPGLQLSATQEAAAGVARTLPSTLVREGPDELLPLTLDLAPVTVQGKPAALGGYLLRVEFDPQSVEVLGVVGADGFQDPVISKTFNSGVVRIVGVHRNGASGTGTVTVAKLRVRLRRAGGLSSVRVIYEDLATGPVREPSGYQRVYRIQPESK